MVLAKPVTPDIALDPVGRHYATQRELERRDVIKWGERHFYIPETGQPIVYAPHQRALLRYIFTRVPNTKRYRFRTVIWSQVKKSGKTTIAGLVGRWAAESWTRFGEVYGVGNDWAQAKGRAFAEAKESIELTPGFDRARQRLPGQWKVNQDILRNLQNGTTFKAVATDYKGEAGGNPILTLWTELWAFSDTAALRFWAEMSPSPTRDYSMRWVETYAGYEGESELLYGLYESTVLKGRQLTAGELGDLSAFEEAPNPDSLIPCWVNESSGTFAYWDSGEQARRMPWQRGEAGRLYYANEAGQQTPGQFRRLHYNEWISVEQAFIPMEVWDACQLVGNDANLIPLKPGERTPLIVGVDAAVSGDCFGIVVVSRDPRSPKDSVIVRAVRKWEPPQGGTINYDGPRQAIEELCRLWNVRQVSYDPYQLHDFSTTLMKKGVAWFKPFNQGAERAIADKSLYDLVTHRKIGHDGNLSLREHIANSNAKLSKDDDSRLRIVKKSEARKIDLTVCLSMASRECLRLML